MLDYSDILFESFFYSNKNNNSNVYYDSNKVLFWFLINLFISFLVFKLLNGLANFYIRFCSMEKKIKNLQNVCFNQKLAYDELKEKYENLIENIFNYDRVEIINDNVSVKSI